MPWISRARLNDLESSVELERKYAEQRLRDERAQLERYNWINQMVVDLYKASPEVRALIRTAPYSMNKAWDRTSLDIVLEYMKRKGTDKRAKEILKQFEE